jgi:phospholipid/cholesterol/gamma-HCH transport system substrate-binding protein
MEDRSHALIAIGFLVVFGIGAALVAWWMLSPTMNRVPYLLESQTSVSGLGPGSPVKYKGVRVGAVRNVQLSANRRDVEVLIGVDADFPLPDGTYATISSAGLIGSNFVDLTLGNGPGTVQTSVASPAHLPLKQGSLAGLMDQAKTIVGDVEDTLHSVQSLLSGQNRKDISDTLADIREASAQLAELEKAAQPAVAQLPGLITQARTTLAAAKDLLANSNRLVVKAQGSVEAVGEAASSTAALSAQINQQSAPALTALLVRLQALTTQLQSLVAQLQATPQSLILGPAKAQPGPGEAPPPAQQGGEQ